LTQLTLGVDRDSPLVTLDRLSQEGGRGRQTQRAALRHLRTGALGLPWGRRVPEAPWHRFR